jgi:hypothetical protein
MSGHDREQVADPLSAGERVGERELGLDRVLVAAAYALPRDVPGVRELAEDAVCGALGDSHRFADVAQTGAWVLRDAQEDSGVVGEKGPGERPVPCHDTRLAFLDSQISYSRERTRSEGVVMPHFKCVTCKTRLYDPDPQLLDEPCPSCGLALERAGELAELVGFRAITGHGTASEGGDDVGDLHERRALQAQARLDAERWVNEGGAAAEAVALPRPDTTC